jgi:hypothetical protein
MGTLPSVLRNLHAAHLAGLLGKVSAHMRCHSNDRTQRCGRSVAPELATEVVRPHSL